MKIRKLYSIVVAAGIMAVALPVIAADGSAAEAPCGHYVADVSAAPEKSSSTTVAERVDLNQLPPPVKATIQAERGTDVITRIDAKTRKGRRVYYVQFKNHVDHARPKLVVAADGTIVSGKHTSKAGNGTEVADVPVHR